MLTVVVTLAVEVESVQVDGVPAEHARQELVVGDMLVDGREDAAPVLEQLLVVPVRVDPLQVVDHPVVFAHQ